MPRDGPLAARPSARQRARARIKDGTKTTLHRISNSGWLDRETQLLHRASHPGGTDDTPMKIYLISPTHYTPDGNLVKSVQYWTSAITLAVPQGADAARAPGDLRRRAVCTTSTSTPTPTSIGLTAMGPQIARAYDLADYFRARGKKVVHRRLVGLAQRRPRRCRTATRWSRARPSGLEGRCSTTSRPASQQAVYRGRQVALDGGHAARSTTRRCRCSVPDAVQEVAVLSDVLSLAGVWRRAAARIRASTARCRRTTSAASARGPSRR